MYYVTVLGIFMYAVRKMLSNIMTLIMLTRATELLQHQL